MARGPPRRQLENRSRERAGAARRDQVAFQTEQRLSIWLGDYDRLLAIAIWLFFGSGFLMLKSPGDGVAYLGPGRPRLRFPSWRAAFGRRLAMVVSPLHSFWPITNVELLAASRANAMAALFTASARLERSMRLARPCLWGVTGIVIILIPARILTHGADPLFLAMVETAYALYVLAVVVLTCTGHDDGGARPPGYWNALLEPLLCLPYSAHLCQKLSALHRLSVPLVDVLRSDVELSPLDLQALAFRIDEMHAMDDDATDAPHYRMLMNLIDRRLKERAT